MDKNVVKEIKKEHKGKVYKFLFGVLARNVETDATHRFLTDSQLEEILKKPGPSSALDNNTVDFSHASSRVNIQSGESLKILFGKIAKWLNDLKAAAFCDVTQSLGVTEHGTVLDGRVGKAINDKFGGLRFYEDASGGKYVVGADSVPKKLGSINQQEWIVVEEEWFGDDSGVPGLHSGSLGNFVGKQGGYVLESKNWHYVLAKDYDIKTLRGDYGQLTADDFVIKVVSYRYAIDNIGHDNDVFNLAGPSVHSYDPATGVLTVKSDGYFTGTPAGGESVSLKLKIMICA